MKTALVTGATSGLGLAFARRLSRDGYALRLVARDGERLGRLAAELGGAVETLRADLTDPEQRARVEAACEGLDLLVNNAGVLVTGEFAELGLEEQDAAVELMVRAVLRLTHAALRDMRRRGRGELLLVSSRAAFAPTAGLATYAACKAFVSSLALSLAAELEGTAIRVGACCPGNMRTEIFERAGVDVDPATLREPADVVDHALAALRRGDPISVHGERAFDRALAGLLPRSLAARLARAVRRITRA